ncbi:hypothetical protein GWK48_02465 [Metallosphaera tengchongensis]|uniref:Uncharacterized protein n=1 Tax=Metallosphaera tengchongensis TaxID=1532350 RepID=A0A6N0NTH0_9CREN|nr:hypothetical protein [Metallosphaera tengchongensis]QKQ99406.1 hypothetical protein GWK48_02465 [Metallosphaera tengchongensis]
MTSGKNVKTVEITVKSLDFWHRELERRYSLRVPHEIWIVLDEGSESGVKERAGETSRLVVVPREV